MNDNYYNNLFDLTNKLTIFTQSMGLVLPKPA